MRFRQRQAVVKPTKKFLPIIPLEKVKIPTDDKDKSAFIQFELKVRSGAGAGTPSYKKFMKTFEEGSPQEWMDVLAGLREIWKQNSVNGPTDRAATVAAILKGDSLTAFETALEDARVDPEDDDVPVPMTTEHIEMSLRSVTEIVFPFRALETQKQWMTRHFKKPYNLSSKKTAAGISRLNNYLPSFPKATASSKYSDQELVEILEVALPSSWRKAMDLKGFIPANNDFKKLLDQMEIIERNETPVKHERDDDNDEDKKEKKVKFAKFEKKAKKNGNNNAGTDRPSKYACKRCGPNPTHDTDACWVIKKEEREKAKKAPYSHRTFRKEVNAMARRAGKNDGLKFFESAVKREQSKLAKKAGRANKKDTKKSRAKKDDSDSDSSTDHSMNNMEARIPRKKLYRKKPERNVKYNSKAEVVEIEGSTDDDSEQEMDTDSSDDEQSNNQASAEEKAFLKAIDKEEQKANKKSNSDNSE